MRRNDTCKHGAMLTEPCDDCVAVPMTTPPPDTKVESETLEQIANRIATDEVLLSHRRQDLYFEILSALRNERERCAKIADERAAFNLRLMKTHQIGDPMADLKSTRADEAEVIAGEIREGRQLNDIQ